MEYIDSIKKSQQIGFHKLWTKYESYEIIDSYIIGNGIIDGFDTPVSYNELPSQVAKLNNRKEKNLLKFFQAYGPFGYKQLNPYTSEKGEPLDWIWAHAKGVYLLLELEKALRDSDFETLINLIKPFEVESDYKGLQKFIFKIGDKGSISEVPYTVGTLNNESALQIAGLSYP